MGFFVGGKRKSTRLRRRRLTVPFLRHAASLAVVMRERSMRVFHGNDGDRGLVVVAIGMIRKVILRVWRLLIK